MELNSLMIEIDDDTFNDEVIEYNDLVLVDFYTTTCGPCRMLAPILERLDIKVCKFNVEFSSFLAKQFEIKAVPTLFFFRNGKFLEKIVGMISEKALKEKIRSL